MSLNKLALFFAVIFFVFPINADPNVSIVNELLEIDGTLKAFFEGKEDQVRDQVGYPLAWGVGRDKRDSGTRPHFAWVMGGYGSFGVEVIFSKDINSNIDFFKAAYAFKDNDDKRWKVGQYDIVIGNFYGENLDDYCVNTSETPRCDEVKVVEAVIEKISEAGLDLEVRAYLMGIKYVR